jgi:hypothetical protein
MKAEESSGGAQAADRLRDLERRVGLLEQALQNLERRLPESNVESDLQATANVAPGAKVETADRLSNVTSLLSLAGRTCLVLGGAFLIRAMTEIEAVPGMTGASLGLGYAAVWLFLADRDGRRGRLASAAFHGIAAAWIAYPLLWEASTRFHLIAPPTGVAAVMLTTAIALTVAWRHPTQTLSWAVTIAALATLIAFLASTGAIVPVAAALIGLTGAMIWLAYEKRWFGPRWPAALVTNLVVLLIISLAARSGGPPELYRGLTPAGAMAVALALPLICLPSFAVRTLVRRREVMPFEILQSGAALLIGFGGAIAVAHAADFNVVALGTAGLAVGVASYGLAFVFVERREGLAANFHFYASLGLLMTLAGSALWLSGHALALVWAAIALTFGMLGGRFRRVTLRWHCAVFTAAAAAASGLAGACLDAFAARAGGAWRRIPATGWWTLAGAVASYTVLAATRRVDARWNRRIPAFFVGSMAVAGIGAAMLDLLTLVPGLDGAAAIAALRSGVLAASAIGLGAAGRKQRLAELSWLVYPILTLGGAKLLFEDLRVGKPLSLFAGFAFFGFALLNAPRLMRTSHSS